MQRVCAQVRMHCNYHCAVKWATGGGRVTTRWCFVSLLRATCTRCAYSLATGPRQGTKACGHMWQRRGMPKGQRRCVPEQRRGRALWQRRCVLMPRVELGSSAWRLVVACAIQVARAWVA